jgi:hypothetical protein
MSPSVTGQNDRIDCCPTDLFDARSEQRLLLKQCAQEPRKIVVLAIVREMRSRDLLSPPILVDLPKCSFDEPQHIVSAQLKRRAETIMNALGDHLGTHSSRIITEPAAR